MRLLKKYDNITVVTLPPGTFNAAFNAGPGPGNETNPNSGPQKLS